MLSIAMTVSALLGFVAPSLVAASPASLSGDSLVDSYWPNPFPRCGPFAEVSCRNHTAQKDLCCFEAPGGHLLSTQLWFYDPNVGEADSWTLHGLWPDNCDGSYSSSCQPSRNVYNVTEILKSYGEHQLLEYMNKYWLNNTGPNELLWEHEWNKHGTCLSTLEPSCFTSHKPSQDVVAYIKRLVALYQKLPTYKFLAAHDIYPTTHKNYTLDQIQGALRHSTGFNATIECDVTNHLTQVYYHYNVKGSLVDGKFFGTNADSPSGCPATGIQYVPKGTPGTPQTCILATC